MQETKRDVSYEHSKSVAASEEGTYEVVAIKDPCLWADVDGQGSIHIEGL